LTYAENKLCFPAVDLEIGEFTMATLFEKLGGKPAVDLAVDKFYEKVLADDRIKHFFEGIDMSQQRTHQRAFLTYAFGGAANYDGKTLRNAHKNLVINQGLSGEHFDAVIENLVATLKDLGVSDELIAEVGEIAATPHQKREVLNQ
jgi:hemoglobin